MRTKTNYVTDFCNYSNNTSAANQTLGLQLVNDALRYLVGVFFFNERTYETVTVAGQQNYVVPFNMKQVINVTVLIGSVLWQPRECATRKQFDALNVIPFNNDFPQFYYIYNGELLIWPTPASNGNAITVHHKVRLRDLSMDDSTTGTVSATSGSTTITGSGTAFKEWMEQQGWIRIAHSTTDAANGDNQWYEIDSVASATSLTLKNAYEGANVAGGSFTIGEVPILNEDFQDLPLYRALYVYHSSIKPDPTKAEYFKALYDEGYKFLEAEFGSKSAGVGIIPEDYPVVNPNLFQQSITG